MPRIFVDSSLKGAVPADPGQCSTTGVPREPVAARFTVSKKNEESPKPDSGTFTKSVQFKETGGGPSYTEESYLKFLKSTIFQDGIMDETLMLNVLRGIKDLPAEPSEAVAWTLLDPYFEEQKKIEQEAEKAKLARINENEENEQIIIPYSKEHMQVVKHQGSTQTDGTDHDQDLQRAIEASMAEDSGRFSADEEMKRAIELSKKEHTGTPSTTTKAKPSKDVMRDEDNVLATGIENIGQTCWFSVVSQFLFHLSKYRRIVYASVPAHLVNRELDMEQPTPLDLVIALRQLFAELEASNRKFIEPTRVLRIFERLFQQKPCNQHRKIVSQQQDAMEMFLDFSELLKQGLKAILSESEPKFVDGLLLEKENQANGNVPSTDAAEPMDVSPTSTTESPMQIESVLGSPPTAADIVNDNVQHPPEPTPTDANVSAMSGVSCPSTPTSSKALLQDDVLEQLFTSIATTFVEGSASEPKEEQGSYSSFTIEVPYDNLHDALEAFHFSETTKFQKSLPEVLIFVFNRFTYNSGPVKLHNAVSFPEELFMGRYLMCNADNVVRIRETLHEKRLRLAAIRAQLEGINQYPLGDGRSASLVTIIDSVRKYASGNNEMPEQPEVCEVKNRLSYGNKAEPKSFVAKRRKILPTPEQTMEYAPQILGQMRDTLIKKRTDLLHDEKSLEIEIGTMYDELQTNKYLLKSVAVHQGEATSGHYFSYVKNLATNQWLKLNDGLVEEVNWEQVAKDGCGDQGNTSAYFLVYVDANAEWIHEEGWSRDALKKLPEDLRAHVESSDEAMKRSIEEQTENELLDMGLSADFINKIPQTPPPAYDYAIGPELPKSAATQIIEQVRQQVQKQKQQTSPLQAAIAESDHVPQAPHVTRNVPIVQIGASAPPSLMKPLGISTSTSASLPMRTPQASPRGTLAAQTPIHSPVSVGAHVQVPVRVQQSTSMSSPTGISPKTRSPAAALSPRGIAKSFSKYHLPTDTALALCDRNIANVITRLDTVPHTFISNNDCEIYRERAKGVLEILLHFDTSRLQIIDLLEKCVCLTNRATLQFLNRICDAEGLTNKLVSDFDQGKVSPAVNELFRQYYNHIHDMKQRHALTAVDDVCAVLQFFNRFGVYFRSQYHRYALLRGFEQLPVEGQRGLQFACSEELKLVTRQQKDHDYRNLHAYNSVVYDLARRVYLLMAFILEKITNLRAIVPHENQFPLGEFCRDCMSTAHAAIQSVALYGVLRNELQFLNSTLTCADVEFVLIDGQLIRAGAIVSSCLLLRIVMHCWSDKFDPAKRAQVLDDVVPTLRHLLNSILRQFTDKRSSDYDEDAEELIQILASYLDTVTRGQKTTTMISALKLANCSKLIECLDHQIKIPAPANWLKVVNEEELIAASLAKIQHIQQAAGLHTSEDIQRLHADYRTVLLNATQQ